MGGRLLDTLATCDWVKKGLPLYLIGDSGTGKSHLLSYAEQADPCQRGKAAHYTTRGDPVRAFRGHT
ncbi:ATP-binding protein [Sinosporangium album]|uniref:ATP-binding protein n=1 Tax=Sinosporangium album TaxID=504805 RepID=UPI001C409B00|nr:ATP-binding protein [Sinosporangium album]